MSSLTRRQACAAPCGASGCCDAGLFCCADQSGCCPTGYTCDASGCCPAGQSCSGFKQCPSDPAQIECADGGCCPPNAQCLSTGGVHSCSTDAGAGAGPGASGTVSGANPTIISTTGGSQGSAPTSSASQTFVNNTVPNTDSRITYQPATAWNEVSGSSGCDSKPVKRSNTIGSSFSFTFQGTAVFLQTATGPDSGRYQVTLGNGDAADQTDAQTSAVDGFSAAPIACAVGFVKTGLPNGIHTINVTLVGSSPQSTTQGTDFDLSSITFTSEENASGGNGAVARGVIARGWTGVMAAWLVGLAVAIFA